MKSNVRFTEDKFVLSQKQARIQVVLKNFGNLGVALSGGVDSTLLLALALDALGFDRVAAFTAVSAIHPQWEREAAAAAARQLGVRHVLLANHELDDPRFRANTPDRCYHCKKNLFKTMWQEARRIGLQALAHGANCDDLADYRPGMAAAEEMGVAAPLISAGMTKADVRGIARQIGLFNWDMPAMACLATRFPYGTELQKADLLRIDQAETFLRQQGVRDCRVRQHGRAALIEIDPAAIERFARPRLRRLITARLLALGFSHIGLDLEGYRSGKLNRDH